jgi:hypothetical protein
MPREVRNVCLTLPILLIEQIEHPARAQERPRSLVVRKILERSSAEHGVPDRHHPQHTHTEPARMARTSGTFTKDKLRRPDHPPGPNKVTADVRNMIGLFVSEHWDQAPKLFAHLAKQSRGRTLKLLDRLSGYIVPRLAAVAVADMGERPLPPPVLNIGFEHGGPGHGQTSAAALTHDDDDEHGLCANPRTATQPVAAIENDPAPARSS